MAAVRALEAHVVQQRLAAAEAVVRRRVALELVAARAPGAGCGRVGGRRGARDLRSPCGLGSGELCERG